MHENGYTYNDLKPENIMIEHFVDNSFRVKLIDYGFVEKFKNSKGDIIP